MPAMIWDTTSSAFKEEETPKVWNGSEFADSVGMVNLGSGWSEGWSGSVAEVVVGTNYTLGSGATTNKGGTITVKCLSTDGSTAVMQTYGVTAGNWSQACSASTYTSYWGTLSSAISGVKLPTGSSKSNISPSESYSILVSAASAWSSFGATGGTGAWLGTPFDSGFSYIVVSNGNVNGHDISNSLVCAPYFNLDLSKVEITDTTITIK